MKEIADHAKEIKELVVSDANHDKFAVMCIGNAKTGELISCAVGDSSKIYFAIAMLINELSELEKRPLEDTLLKASQLVYEIEKEEAKEDGSGDDEDDD